MALTICHIDRQMTDYDMWTEQHRS